MYFFIRDASAKPVKLDLIEQTGLFQRARSRWQADTRWNYDALQIWERLDQRQRLLLIYLLAFLSISDLDKLHASKLWIARQRFLHRSDPCVLITGCCRGREDRELALVTDDPDRAI